MYGGPGKFRFKPYGVEYRTPSNVWLDKPKLQRQIFDCCLKAEQYVAQGGVRYRDYADGYTSELVDSMARGTRCEILDSLSNEWW